MRNPKDEVIRPATGMPMKPRRSLCPLASNQLAWPSASSQRTSSTLRRPWSMPANSRSPSRCSPVAARSRWMIRSKLSAAPTSRPIDRRVASALI
ncbi:hypothetical protein WR25_01401 [Diploscapter pachys]|uniref:Uncharacterized protein n=1 Tax=Diploscapter pachys TaxID=2018661 RepID=A0A2A2M5G2_9BILA|nr:hypothetical protein WR25_01401 [Diploscapter pachys]